jgi:hypothetical protein
MSDNDGVTPWDYIDYLKDNADREEANVIDAATLGKERDQLQDDLRDLKGAARLVLAVYDRAGSTGPTSEHDIADMHAAIAGLRNEVAR